MAIVKIEKDWIETIKEKRKSLGLSQKEMAEYLNITLSKYQRFEAKNYTTFDQTLLKQISNKLEIDEDIFNDSLKISPTTKLGIRLKNETLKRIKMIEVQHNFNSTSQAINYILEEYFLNLDLAKVRYEIEDMFKETVLKSWATTVKDLDKENFSNQKFLDYILETYNIDEEQERKNYISLEQKRKNINKW